VSAALTDWLDPIRVRDLLANDAAMSDTPWWRIEANWSDGQGGFAYSLPFATYADALTWGKSKARFHAGAVVTVTPSNDEPEPTMPRPCAGITEEGASHATTKHDDDIELHLNRRRPGQRENSLTQQATNRTSVTARKDGQPFNVPLSAADRALAAGFAGEMEAGVKS
jgi:hypothetical protein